ncbi:sce7726 family protein [Myxococcus sp. CA040A]|uniref:sce7726 family protein n=1 Tax=Myxococcus sp. CA040A TaxID=2741738 RepID=UPI00157AE7BD|nr:sce7726 family protein [Myxococcus sp. CA040A]NTX07033.1 sce7726 family protein [Myxococcus sp. CA040A]
MRDIDVRRALQRDVLSIHAGEVGTLVLNELGLEHGLVRVDVAVINGAIHGYELKSDKDTLDRLPAQVRAYSAALDMATLVAGERHLKAARKMVPRWWGLCTAIMEDGGTVRIEARREAKQNPKPTPLAIANLLWREEALDVLERLGHATGIRSKPRKVLYAKLVEVLSLDELRDVVRVRLKSRTAWRPDALRT